MELRQHECAEPGERGPHDDIAEDFIPILIA